MNLFSKVKNATVNVLGKILALSLRNKLILLVLIILIGWFGIKPLFDNAQKENVEYQTATVEKGTLITSVTASGTVSSASSANITSNATGVVKEIYVKNGDTVTKGDKIAEITLDTDSQQRQTAAWASYLSAQNTVNVAKAKMNSLQSALFKANQAFVTDKGSTADPDTDDPTYIQERADWLQAEADYNNQELAIKQAEAALSSTSLSYQQTSSTITAPMSGIVTNVSLTQGLSISNSSSDSSSDNSSGAGTSQTFGSISLEDAKPQATVSLSEIDVTQVTTDQKVTMTLDAFPDKTFTGRVSTINTNGVMSSGVTSYPVTITFDTSPPNMYPNMAVNATIISAVKNNVILVPSSAVQTANGESTVRIRRNGQISQVTVETGDVNDIQIEIVSGLRVGDEVVTGQTGGATRTTGGQQGTSPFGGSGFGGRGFGGGGVIRSGGGGGAGAGDAH